MKAAQVFPNTSYIYFYTCKHTTGAPQRRPGPGVLDAPHGCEEKDTTPWKMSTPGARWCCKARPPLYLGIAQEVLCFTTPKPRLTHKGNSERNW